MNLVTKAPCPMCSSTMEFNWETRNIPYFGEALLITGICCCGFRHSDTMLLSQKEPLRHTLVVDGLDDLNVRVIRSTSGTIRIPELGIDVEPGFASESYISNVEGVLERIRTIVEFATNAARRAGDIQKTERGLAILEKLDNVLVGYGSLTLVLEDPFGNSAMISEDVVVTPLTPEELESLKTGMIVLDRSCL